MGPSRDRIRFPQLSTVAGRSSRSTRRCSGIVVRRSISPRGGGRRKHHCETTDGAFFPYFAFPTVVTLAGFVALARWESRDSRAARRSAWAVALVFLVAMLISMGAGPYFWPAAAALLLAASVRQGSWWTISGAWLVSLLLMLAVYSMTGVGLFFWSSGVVLLLATGTLGARLLGGGRLS